MVSPGGVQPEPGSQAISRAIGLLELFTVDEPSWSHSEIAAASGLTASTSHRLLRALLAHELVILDDRKRYSLGPAVMRMAHVILSSGDVGAIQSAAQPHLAVLRDHTGETVGLHVRVGRERVCVAELESRQPIRMASTVGIVLPLYAGAASKAILAYLGSDQRSEILLAADRAPLTRHTITDLDALAVELDRTRARGYAMSFGESVEGASALAAPIFGASGEAVACINVTGPEDRWGEAEMQVALPALLESTAAISRAIGYAKR